LADPFHSSDLLVRELYESLLSKLKVVGPYKVEGKKTSLHLVNRAAFLGVHPKKEHLELNVVSSAPLDAKRGYKIEQVSKNRYHNRVRIERASDLDPELIHDIADAYRLMS